MHDSKICLEKQFCPKSLGHGPKIGIFEFKEKFGYFSLNLFYNENLYYLRCSCANAMFGKNLVPVIQTKILSANQMAGFFNQLFFQNKLMIQTHFMHFDTNSHEFKIYQTFFG